jgi:hypothetical protein
MIDAYRMVFLRFAELGFECATLIEVIFSSNSPRSGRLLSAIADRLREKKQKVRLGVRESGRI